ncbi:divIVA domain containing protein [Clostridium sp. CAG:762]|jgi:cell division initiation protein|nr:divIVA domain containing protein [Clostridium sp. CAG:762]
MKKFSIVEKGYNQKEVNEFLDIVINRLEKVVAENNKLNLQIEELKKELKENGNAEERLNKAILAVQETSDRMKELARAESQMIIEDAKRNANSIIHEALVNAEKTEYQANCLRKNITVYKNRVKSILESQIEIAEDLDKIEI